MSIVGLGVVVVTALGACGTTRSVSPGGTGATTTGGAAVTTTTPTPESTVATTTGWEGTIVATEAEIAAQTAALDAAVARWEGVGAPTYTFTLTNGCFCAPETVGPIDIVVVDGVVQSMTLTDQVYDTTWIGSTVPAAQQQWIAGTAEALFDLIRGRIGQKDFEATYDATTGFPVRFYSDPIPAAVDDEFGFSTEHFGIVVVD